MDTTDSNRCPKRGGSSQEPSTFQQYSIDHGTELFRKKLEEDAKAKETVSKERSPVVGGLPPHLLRQSQQGNQASNTQTAGAQQPDNSPRPGLAQSRHNQARRHPSQQNKARQNQGRQNQAQQSQAREVQLRQSNPFQPCPSEARRSDAVATEYRGIEPTYGNQWGYSPSPNDSAPRRKQIVHHQHTRPKPIPTPPLERPDTLGAASASKNVPSHQQQQPPPPTPAPIYRGNAYGRLIRTKTVLMPARDAPGTHPALKGIMSSRCLKEVQVVDDSPEQESFPVQRKDVMIRKQSTMPQQGSTAQRPERLAPHRESPTPDIHGGDRLSTTLYQEGHVQPTSASQWPEVADQWSGVNQSQPMAFRQRSTDVAQLEKKPKWRPKHSADLESQSLPYSVSSVCSENDEVKVRDAADGIQGETATNLGPTLSRNGQSFCNKRQDPQAHQMEGGEGSSTQGWSVSYQPKWIQDWAHDVDTPHIMANVTRRDVEKSEDCDVDTSTGFLMRPVDCPPTCVNPQEKNHPAMSKRFSGSAQLNAAANFEKNKRRLDKSEKKNRERELEDPSSYWRPVTEPFHAPQPSPPSTQHMVGNAYTHPRDYDSVGDHENSGAQYQTQANELANQGLVRLAGQNNNLEWDSYVKISCHMRPAEQGDLPQILDIYNWEVLCGIQALDSQPLSLQDMQRVFEQCASAQTPFVVMIEGTSSEAILRKETAATPWGPSQAYRQGPRQQTRKPEQDKVLGFGFINIASVGLAGGIHRNVGRFHGRAHFYVANESRRKGVGRALMSRLAQCCSSSTVSLGEYEWYDPNRTAACDTVAFNARNYSRLFIETASRGKNDPETIWLGKLLDSEHFFCISTLENARKVGHDDRAFWLDNLVWALDCQEPKYIKENIKRWQ